MANRLRALMAITAAVIAGKAVVIVRSGNESANVYCGNKISRDFIKQSMVNTLRTLLTN